MRMYGFYCFSAILLYERKRLEMGYIIRQAKKDESIQIAPLIYDAIGDIAFRLTGETNEQNMLLKLQMLVEDEHNRHSYLNTFVAVDAAATHKVLGIVVLYDGKKGDELDRALEKALFNEYGHTISIDVEAHHDEYYIDTICVSAEARGLGIGTALLAFAEEQAATLGYSKLSLNVEVGKVQARALYTRIGFQETEPWTIINEPFIHMVKRLD